MANKGIVKVVDTYDGSGPNEEFGLPTGSEDMMLNLIVHDAFADVMEEIINEFRIKHDVPEEEDLLLLRTGKWSAMLIYDK